jgi:hypothetical protein
VKLPVVELTEKELLVIRTYGVYNCAVCVVADQTVCVLAVNRHGKCMLSAHHVSKYCYELCSMQCALAVKLYSAYKAKQASDVY